MSAETENTPAVEAPQSPAVVKKAGDPVAKAKPQAFGKPVPKAENRPAGNPAPAKNEETPATAPQESSAVSDALSIFGWDID